MPDKYVAYLPSAVSPKRYKRPLTPAFTAAYIFEPLVFMEKPQVLRSVILLWRLRHGRVTDIDGPWVELSTQPFVSRSNRAERRWRSDTPDLHS